jgi:hypothetical protein
MGEGATPPPAAWPWYEARLSVHVREKAPTEAFGEGGEELAHVRASTQAPTFPQAVARLDADLAAKWTQVMANAELVDQPPSPDVLPAPPPSPRFFGRVVSLPKWVLVLNLILWVAFFVHSILEV